MFEHENDWSRALGGYNMMLQACATTDATDAAPITNPSATKGYFTSILMTCVTYNTALCCQIHYFARIEPLRVVSGY